MQALSHAATTVTETALWPLRTIRQSLSDTLGTLDIFLGGFGLVAALVAAALLSPALGALPGAAGDFAPIGMAVVLAPVGIAVALSRRAEVERWVGALRPPEVAGGIGVPGIALATQVTPPLIVDTSAIIDGRLPSVAAAGFLPSALVVPRFVLDELRRVADDAEPLRRQRGRRGLEALAKLQEDGHAQIQIAEEDFPEAADVDAKLLALARVRRGALLTTNANLSRVANVEQIHVLNFNALAEAMHVQLLPGELLQVQVQQEGRERRQGVGYLEDGTMVVIEEGRELLGEDVAVEVQRVIHTSAGRMVFAEVQGASQGREERA